MKLWLSGMNGKQLRFIIFSVNALSNKKKNNKKKEDEKKRDQQLGP